MNPLGQIGWIGIDIGSSSVKLAQLTRSKKKLRLSGLAIISRRNAWPTANLSDHEPLSSADEICAAVSLRPGFRGKHAAATLPMALCNTHTLDRPNSQPPAGQNFDQRQFVRAAIEMATQRSAEHLQFDVWNAEAEAGQAPKQANILSVATSWTDQLYADVTQLDWSCQTIDGLPLSLARAVAMDEQYDPAEPIAALDWGYAKATLCIISGGSPVYVRSFKGCGLHHLLQSLCENLDITQEEALCLLQEHGITSSVSSDPSPTGKLIEEIIAEPISRLVKEYQRTIAHLQCQRRTILPKRLVLFGGGATINGLAVHLSERLESRTQVWRFENLDPDLAKQPRLSSCLFGPAIALSALAWEKP